MNTDIQIRPCDLRDALALSRVGAATFLETYAPFLPRADMLTHCAHAHAETAYAGWLADADYRLWLAEDAAGKAVGYVMLCPPDVPVATAPSDLEIRRIYLLARCQGGGAGRRLMEVALDASRAAGAARVLLGVMGDNAAARGFYARLGFTEVGVRTFQVGATLCDDLVLARPL